MERPWRAKAHSPKASPAAMGALYPARRLGHTAAGEGVLEGDLREMSAGQAMIAAMITPTLLILAAGSLIGAALMRLERIIDRVRALAEHPMARPFAHELARQKQRASHAQRALELFFSAIVLFVGAAFGIAIDKLSGDRLAWLPIAATALGMALIVAGTAMLLLETRLARIQVDAEIDALGGAPRR